MIREAPAMTVRQNLGDLLSEVQYRKGKVIITKAGKPIAALVDIALFERIRKLDEEFDRMRKEFAKAFADLPERQAEALADEAVKAARTRRRSPSGCSAPQPALMLMPSGFTQLVTTRAPRRRNTAGATR